MRALTRRSAFTRHSAFTRSRLLYSHLRSRRSLALASFSHTHPRDARRWKENSSWESYLKSIPPEAWVDLADREAMEKFEIPATLYNDTTYTWGFVEWYQVRLYFGFPGPTHTFH